MGLLAAAELVLVLQPELGMLAALADQTLRLTPRMVAAAAAAALLADLMAALLEITAAAAAGLTMVLRAAMARPASLCGLTRQRYSQMHGSRRSANPISLSVRVAYHLRIAQRQQAAMRL
jgi:hypothetical protein